MTPASKLWVAALLCCCFGPQSVAALSRFRSWFPRFETALNHIVDVNCSSQYAAWLAGDNYPDRERERTIWTGSEIPLGTPLIDCILDECPETIKADFASAAVLLGLMPSLLALIGPSIRETSVLLTMGHRPVLAVLLCIGSPLVGLERDIFLRGSIPRLKDVSRASGYLENPGVTCLKYGIALGAIANIAEIIWELGLKASYSWFQGDAWVLGLWAFIGFVIHVFGAFTLASILFIGHDFGTTKHSTFSNIAKWLRWRFTLSRQGTQAARLRVLVQHPSAVYLILLALLTILTTCQIVFGTVIFSGILFVGTRDGVFVFLRFLASVVACRMLVLMELAFVQSATTIVDADDLDKEEHQLSKQKERPKASPEVNTRA